MSWFASPSDSGLDFEFARDRLFIPLQGLDLIEVSGKACGFRGNFARGK